MDQTTACLLLNSVPEIGPVRFKRLTELCGDAVSVFSASVAEISAAEGMSAHSARRVLEAQARNMDLVQSELRDCRSRGISILTVFDPGYPSLLKGLSDPPPVLYAQGRLRLLHGPALALVGTRKPTPYGESVAARLAAEAASAGIAVVSGLARGIDTAVHRAALPQSGSTIAVLGSGLLRIYPPENSRLAASIACDGLLLSEFPLLKAPEPGHFPRRNRIIAGLSLGTVVIEADRQSGALITARLAAEQGKDVFAVPGPIHSAVSRGPHRLIKEGAKLVESIEDVLEEIAPFKGKLVAADCSRDRAHRDDACGELWDDRERAVLDLIQASPLPIDALLERSNIPPGEFSETLLRLELKGAVRSLPGKRYARC